VRSAPIDRYPDPDATEVREALAGRWRVAFDQVAFGNGASELLWALAAARWEGRRLLLVEPAFGEVRAAAEAAGAEVVAWRARRRNGLALEVEAIAEAIARNAPDVVALCAPSTPSGAPLAHAGVLRLAEACPAAQLLLDESFLSLSDQHADRDRPLPAQVLRLRSLTKDHAIPGVRAGYLLAPAEVVAALERCRPAWPTGTLAQAAALAAVADEAFVDASRAKLFEDRAALVAGLRALGLAPLPSAAPYLVFDAPPSAGELGPAAALRRRLLGRGVLVRDCASFGLPALVRVAVRPAAERERLLAALRSALSNPAEEPR
jgi:histidinol-phosphate/aromatic aminotransferase/cobyric acid decarboxylase-like protein